LGAQGSQALQKTLAAFLESLSLSETKYSFSSLIPRTNLALFGYREGGIGRTFEQIE
jgi:hypothetical protein